MKLACVPVCNYFTSDNRVLRTCRFLMKHGFEVHVLAIGRADLADDEVLGGIHIHRFRSGSTKTIRRGVNTTALRAFGAYVAGCVAWARRHRPEVIHYNDWNTLFVGPLSGVKHRAIYDMHELFQDLDYLNFPRAINRSIAAIDRVGLGRAEAVICVSQPIKEELERLTSRPVYLVRNIPDAPAAGEEAPGLGEHMRDGRKHLVYLGALQKGKGALYMLQVLSHLPDAFVLDCFSGRSAKNDFFLAEAARLGLSSRISVFDYIPQSQLCATVRHAFAGISVFIPSSRIYDYALPNKVFEYLLAGLPVITSNARAQAELVTECGVGLVADMEDAAQTAERIATWDAPRVTSELLQEKGLTWEHEEAVLLRVYRDLGIV